MTRKTLRLNSRELETWDDETGLYTRSDATGAAVESRALTDVECAALDPNGSKVKELNAVVDQLVLDMLMGGLF